MATFAVLVALAALFDAAAFRRAALADLFAPPDPWVAPTAELLRFRFESFVTSLFILARIVLPVPRAALVFDAGLLFPSRFRTLDDEGRFEARFGVDFALDAAAVFFVFDLVGFFDLLRADIVNLSTREHPRTHPGSAHEHCSKSVHEHFSFTRRIDVLSTKSLASSL